MPSIDTFDDDVNRRISPSTCLRNPGVYDLTFDDSRSSNFPSISYDDDDDAMADDDAYAASDDDPPVLLLPPTSSTSSMASDDDEDDAGDIATNISRNNPL
jgi:hypothetical protein